MDQSSNSVFGASYAGAYDAFYAEKDYESECDLVEALLREHGRPVPASILDLGCGTGGHAIPLARRGHHVVGVDRSEAMLHRARVKAGDGADTPMFVEGDIRNVDLHERFDAVVILFAVLGYQLNNADVLATLRAARQHLKTDGVLMFDIWHGPAVLAQRPGQRVRHVTTDDGRILRVADGRLDVNAHRCTVDYQLWHMRQDRLIGYSSERHEMRFFFPQELRLFLEMSGFAPMRLGAFPRFNEDPDENTWNAMCVARALPMSGSTPRIAATFDLTEVGW